MKPTKPEYLEFKSTSVNFFLDWCDMISNWCEINYPGCGDLSTMEIIQVFNL